MIINIQPKRFITLNFIRLCFLLLLLLAGVPKLFAQETTGSLSGRITDETSAFLPGATVTAVHEPTGTKYITKTNSISRYALVNLRVGGPYTVTVTFVGYDTQTKDSIMVALGSAGSVDFVMPSNAKLLNIVEIKGSQSSKANSTGAGTNIGSATLRNLPAGARSLQDYTRLTPQYNGNSFVGTNFRYNNVTIDGAINNDAIGFSPSLGGQTGISGQIGSSTRSNPISIDAIQDIQVYVAPYDVKIGNFTGGSINAVTRSGTNHVEGSVYAFGKLGSFTGPDHASGTGRLSNDYHDLQTGFRIGFPIIRNKLFFFTNAELTDNQQPLAQTINSAITQPILTAADAQRIYDFYNSDNYKKNIDPQGLYAGPGTAGDYTIYAKSKKFFNRVDWNISDQHQLSVRSNVVTSEATNLTRDAQNFRFSGIDFVQHNNQVATVSELKSTFNSTISNNLVLGYTTVHDYRNPLSYAYYPQIQIAGNTSGTTILLGTDREASVFNMRQKSFEITDNVTIFKGRHTFTIGTHNELYNITYDFVNSPNGRIDYASINDFIAGQPSRIRGNFYYNNQDRDYLFNNPVTQFKVNLYSVYAQDEIAFSTRFKLIPGLRLDMTAIPDKQKISLKTTRARTDPFYGTTYTYTKPADIDNGYLGKIQFSPRVGFNFDLSGDKKTVLRGGTGLFTGRIPFAWLGYAFYNNGADFGSFDKRYNYVGNPSAIPPVPPTIPAAGTDPRIPSRNGIAAIAANENGLAALNGNGPTQVDYIDNDFKMPQVWRTSAALDVDAGNGYKFSIEGVYTKTIYDVQFKQINVQDSVSYYLYDRNNQQPIFSGRSNDPAFSAMYLMTNTHQGYRYSATAQLSKRFLFGLDLMAAYTYGESKDLANGIRNSMESNWQLNQSLNPNNPGLAYSNFDVRHRIIGTVNYRLSYGAGKRMITNVSAFISASSGQPFTYGFVNPSVSLQNTGQQVGLVYIPTPEETFRYFQGGRITLSNGSIVQKSQADQAEEFNKYLRSVPYLSSHRGQFTERNGARTPWNTNADLRISQTFLLNGKLTKGHSFTITYDIFNLTNLLYKNWGRVYFSSDLFNSAASVGLKPTGRSVGGYPTYTWELPTSPYQIDVNQSRWQMQLGLRYNF
ncbi:TonB-dependent receptor [Mucilaginibacter gynuensis]|uniref:TonB-dependent receptor n=1 Tax=Mucilaginibacter gynuensis TaxID=1302236 RepID=A0ABP8FXE3_9SPHI